MRTISLRLPIAHALLASRCGVIGKHHPWDDKLLGLQCSTQGGDNVNLRTALVLATLLPPLRNIEPPPMGHVFASARVVARVSAMPTPQQTVLAIYERAAGIMSQTTVSRWFSIESDHANYYVLTDVRPCKPTRWRGVMSCFPVPDEVFR